MISRWYRAQLVELLFVKHGEYKLWMNIDERTPIVIALKRPLAVEPCQELQGQFRQWWPHYIVPFTGARICN